jgi:hypothetical protein
MSEADKIGMEGKTVRLSENWGKEGSSASVAGLTQSGEL